MNPDHHSNKHKREADNGLIQPEASRNHIEGDQCSGRFIDDLRKLMYEISSSVVSSNLDKSIDSFTIEVKDGVFIFEVELLALNDDWLCVDEEHDC